MTAKSFAEELTVLVVKAIKDIPAKDILYLFESAAAGMKVSIQKAETDALTNKIIEGVNFKSTKP
jgi:hypothetical protein